MLCLRSHFYHGLLGERTGAPEINAPVAYVLKCPYGFGIPAPLGVTDVSKSVAFYCDIVGLERKNRFESLAFFAAGPIMLMLNGGMHRPDGPITGATEIVFAAESVTAEYERLKKLGCSFVREPREVTPGSWAAVFSDPDGHWLTAFGPR